MRSITVATAPIPLMIMNLEMMCAEVSDINERLGSKSSRGVESRGKTGKSEDQPRRY